MMRRKVDSAGDLLPKAVSGKTTGNISSSKTNMRQNISLMLGLAVFVLVVFTFSHLVSLSQPHPSEHLSTGADEGLEQLVDNWGKQPTHALQQQATAAAAGVASGAHTNASQQGKLVAEGDDGSLVVDTAAKPTAGLSASASGKTTLPPAAALHGHHDAATDAAARSQTVNELPDPFGAPDHHHDPVYAARIDPHAPAAGLYALSALDITGKQQSLSHYAGKVSIVVNVASKCGFTESNYKGLEKLYEKYKWHGLEVLAFPCNQFGAQEPGTCEEIMHFAKQNFQVTFPMFDKVDVNGPNAHEVYKFLKGNLPAAQGGGKDLAWNFQKFIVNRQGQPVKLHTQAWDQAAMERDVYDLLRQPAAGGPAA